MKYRWLSELYRFINQKRLLNAVDLIFDIVERETDSESINDLLESVDLRRLDETAIKSFLIATRNYPEDKIPARKKFVKELELRLTDEFLKRIK